MPGALEIVQIVAEMAMFGQTLLNVYHAVSSNSLLDEDAMSDLATRLGDAYALIANRQSDDLTAVGLTFKNITTNEDMGTESFVGYTGGTDNTNDPLPAGVALCVTLPTAVLKSRGRKFVPGIAETGTTAGLFTSAVMTDAASFAALISEAWLGASNDDPWTFGIVTELGTFRPFQSASVSNVPAYQRRRKQGVGI